MKLKKILGAILSAGLCLSMFTSKIEAYDNDYLTSLNNTTSQDTYAFGAMSRYVSLQEVEKLSDISISTPISLNNLDDSEDNKTIYFAINNDSLIGMMTVDNIDGEFASSYISIDYAELNSAYINSTPISLNIIDECLVLFNGSSRNVLIDSKGDDISASRRSSFSLTTLSTIENTNQPLELTNYNSRSVLLNQQLNVTRVANSSVNGIGICWAATIAQNVNYMNGTSYTARNIYDLCSANYTGTPAGNSTWYSRAYSLCGVTATINSSAINYSQIYGLLSNSRPIQIDIKRTDTNGVEHGHAVTLSGITVIDTPSTHAYYYLVDPNVTTGAVCVEVPYSVMINGSNFTYVASNTRTYTSWYRTVYKSWKN